MRCSIWPAVHATTPAAKSSAATIARPRTDFIADLLAASRRPRACDSWKCSEVGDRQLEQHGQGPQSDGDQSVGRKPGAFGAVLLDGNPARRNFVDRLHRTIDGRL